MIKWDCKSYGELSLDELYKILQLRIQVFVVEQNCVFQDCDDKDQESFHFMGWEKDELIAYTRIMPDGLAYDDYSIGRVVTSQSVRKTGVGRELLKRSIAMLYELFGKVSITIGAQLYLKNFYESFGFAQSGAVYLEDGIEHIKMKLN